MAWPTIPALIYSDSVRARTASWSQDPSKGRLASYGAWGRPAPCSVVAASSEEAAAHSRESMVVSHKVVCDTRLGYLRDQLLWDETGATLTIVSVQPAGDRTGRIWEHFCEERPTR